MKLTKKKAIELSIAKWQLHVQHNGYCENLDTLLPEIKDFAGHCGLCELYGMNGCKGCPILLNPEKQLWQTGCQQHNHPFLIWSINNSVETAQAVLDLIIEKTNKTKKNETN
jgi:hypothetical protein